MKTLILLLLLSLITGWGIYMIIWINRVSKLYLRLLREDGEWWREQANSGKLYPVMLPTRESLPNIEWVFNRPWKSLVKLEETARKSASLKIMNTPYQKIPEEML